VFTDAGDQVKVRCSFTWDPSKTKVAGGRVPTISVPEHQHQAEFIFKNSPPFTLRWGD